MKREAEVTLIDIGLALLFFVLPHEIAADGSLRFQALAELLEHGRLSDAKVSLVGPLFSAPLYLLGKLFLTPEWWCARFNTLVLAGGLGAIYALLRQDVDRGLLRKFFLVLIAASMFPNHLREYFGEVFTAVTVAVGILGLRFGRPLAGWTAVVLGVVNTPAASLGLALVAVKQTWDTKRWRHLAPIAVAASLIMLEAWIRRGGPFVTGYAGNAGFQTLMPYSGQPGFSYPLFFGLLSILLSFGKGIVFFAPGLLLPIGRRPSPDGERLRASQHSWIWFLAGLILVYAKWWSWYGGWFWGPRFFLIASVPASLAIAVWLTSVRGSSLLALVWLLGVLTLSVWVGVDGALYSWSNLQVCTENNFALEHLCWYAPEFSVLWRPFVSPAQLPAAQMVIAAYCAIVYVWLAGPVVGEIGRSVARTVAAVRSRGDLTGWRF